MKQPDMPAQAARRPGTFAFAPVRLFRRYLRRRLDAFEFGRLQIELPNGEVIHHSGEKEGPTAAIIVKRWRLLAKLLMEGDVGLARAYVDDDWSSPDLGAVLDFGVCNEAAVTDMTRGVGLAHFWNRFGHRRNANTKDGSKRNIAAHYDLGNEFYQLWLDRDMTYSSGIYSNAGETLETAQDRKLQRAIDLLALRGGESVLEIGCGWGALAHRLTKSGAGHVTGISLSNEQIEHARAMLGRRGVSERVTIEHRDYRDVRARYDRIVSIEMFEAVGEKYWPEFFGRLNQSLHNDGHAVLQIITIADHLFESYRARPDFIQQYIFPGGMLPTVAMVHEQAERAGFEIVAYEPFGASYALTLQAWRQRFHGAWGDIQDLGFDDRFRRMWDYYLHYCEVGFRRGCIDVGLFRLVRAN